MEKTLEEIASEALKLGEDDQLMLAEQMIHSVPSDDATQVWEAEISRRVDDITSGKVRGIPADQVQKELQDIVS